MQPLLAAKVLIIPEIYRSMVRKVLQVRIRRPVLRILGLEAPVEPRHLP
jgi:hypothetical protein